MLSINRRKPHLVDLLITKTVGAYSYRLKWHTNPSAPVFTNFLVVPQTGYRDPNVDDSGTVTIYGDKVRAIFDPSSFSILDDVVWYMKVSPLDMSGAEISTSSAITVQVPYSGEEYVEPPTESTLASIDGKITTCDTDSVTISSSALPTGAATNGELELLKALLGAQRNSTTPNVTTTTQRLLEVARDGSLRVNADLYDWKRQAHFVASGAGAQVAFVRTPPSYPFDGLWVGTNGVIVYGQPRGRPLHVADGLTFADPTKWTGSGADWAISGNKATHTASGGGGDDLVATINGSLDIGFNYLVYVKGTKTAGTNLTAYCGSTAGTAITTNAAFEFVQVLQCAGSSSAKVVATNDCACEVTAFAAIPATPLLADKGYGPFALSEMFGVATDAAQTTLLVATGCSVYGLWRRVPGVADLG